MATANPSYTDEEWHLKEFAVCSQDAPMSLRECLDKLVTNYGGGTGPTLGNIIQLRKAQLWAAGGISAGQKTKLLGPKNTTQPGTTDLRTIDISLAVWLVRNLFEKDINRIRCRKSQLMKELFYFLFQIWFNTCSHGCRFAHDLPPYTNMTQMGYIVKLKRQRDPNNNT